MTIFDLITEDDSISCEFRGLFEGPHFANPYKTREDKISELVDYREVELYDDLMGYEEELNEMDNEQLDYEYEEKIGTV